MTDKIDPAASRFKGFCFDYDRFRPVPPDALMELGAGWAAASPLELVVDLGCGTGLSTRPWAKHSQKVIGIDPAPDMLTAARDATKELNVEYLLGHGNSTSLKDNVADIVTCATSVHWMEPASTVAEVTRLLRPKGVLMIYDHYYPMFLTSPELTRFYEKWRPNTIRLERELKLPKAQKWTMQDAYDAVSQSNSFPYARKHYMHKKLSWTAEEVKGFIHAHSVVQLLKENGHTDTELLLDELDAILENSSQEAYPLHLTYATFIAVRS